VGEDYLMKLVTVQEMRDIEQQANAGGLSYEQMMDKAGQGVAKEILARYPEYKRTIVGLVGSGNNGGDTLVALGTLAKQGWMTFAYQVKPRSEDDALLKWFLQCGGSAISMNQDKNFRKLEEWIKTSSIFVDGVLGTGIELPLKPDVASLLKFVSSMKHLPTVVAVDCPSGVDCNTGEAATECIPADLTLCMAAIKTGLLNSPACNLVGVMSVIDIGLPKKLESWAKIEKEVVSPDEVRKVLPERPMDANKGTFGTAMIAAGSINFMGAAYLSGSAAYRIGAGLVRLAVPEILATTLAGNIPEATWLILPDEMGVISEAASEVLLMNLQKVDALLMGPGWGMEETTGHFLEAILKNKRDPSKAKRVGFLEAEGSKPVPMKNGLPPLVIDADGLKHLSRIKDWSKVLPSETILTPHPGEMAFISGKTVTEIQANRLDIAQEYAKLWKVVLVLKGANTVVAEPGGLTKVIPIASPALAKAGTGDSLAGIITGLRAQGLSAFDAAWAGAWIHARAGVLAAKTMGTTASVLSSEVIQSIPKVFSELSY
jgi:ADP-dependent NAD(P)H-hydrate dehydratase / NAD(P)H-hydrate epimerase